MNKTGLIQSGFKAVLRGANLFARPVRIDAWRGARWRNAEDGVAVLRH
jgi:hypothetical protein